LGVDVGEGMVVGSCVGSPVDVGNNVTVGAGGKDVDVATGALTQANIKISDIMRMRWSFVFIYFMLGLYR